jgi:hypothetical protein
MVNHKKKKELLKKKGYSKKDINSALKHLGHKNPENKFQEWLQDLKEFRIKKLKEKAAIIEKRIVR